ncbi:hypothetical protein RIF29_31475 [Crotalaria pallida]|uniref:Uncharacterized protein n=1 Tax=Crotalaria pallida TaxID=3830 RepID=A0AAN9HXL7_CROPI
MKAKLYTLRNQKMELDRKVMDMQSTLGSLKEEQKVMESAFEETQKEIRIMQQKRSNSGQGGSEIIALRENLKLKEAEIKDLKEHLEIPLKNRSVSINHTVIFPETVAANRTMAAQDKIGNENLEKVEHSDDSAKYGDDDKHIITEDASEGKSTMIKDGEATVGVKDEIRKDEKLGKKNEDPQDDGGSGVAAKGIKSKVVDGSEKKAIEEQQPRQLKRNTDGGAQDSNVQRSEDNRRIVSGIKRKHGHASRAKDKRWRTIVKNSLMENYEISESHKEVNKGNIKVYKDEKGELKDRIVGGVSGEEDAIRKDDGKDNDDVKKDELRVNFVKTENHEENKEDANNIIANNTTEKGRLDEIKQSEVQEGGAVQQNWNRRHVNKAGKNVGQTKPNMSDEEPEELEVSDAEKQKKDEIDVGDDNEDNEDDFPKESQSEFDEKEEYKEEIDESEFHSGL